MVKLTKQQIADLSKADFEAAYAAATAAFDALCEQGASRDETRAAYDYEKLFAEEAHYRRGRDNAIRNDVRRVGSFFS